MIFEVTIMVGSNDSLEYDASGSVVEKSSYPPASFIVPDSKVGKFTVIKDPILDHINLYALELYDLPLDIITAFKSLMVVCVLVRIGSGKVNGVKNFDLNKAYIKPIQILEQSIQNDGIKNDIVIKGISLTAHAILMDSSFGAEMQDIKTYSDAQSLNVGKSASNVDYTTTAGPIPANAALNVANFNPGNIIDTNIQWQGVVGSYKNFEKFATPELGFRALMMNIQSKIRNGQTTLGDIISVWAPPHENDTAAYQQFMSKTTGLNLNDKVTEKDYANLAKAISWYEGDNKTGYYTDAMINAGAAMAGFNTSVSITIDKNNPNYSYGTGNTNNASISGTNVNRSINIYSNIKGSAVLDNVLNRMKEKYKINVNVDAMAGIVKSNFLYKNISFPGTSTLEILKRIHTWYPAYYAEVPWIIDDMKLASSPNDVGKTWYVEIGLLDIQSLPVRSLLNTFAGAGGSAAAYQYFSAEPPRKYYHETPERIAAKTIVYKEIPTGIETVFKAESTMEMVSVPNVNMDSTTTVGIDKLKINSQSIVHVEAGYTAEEFSKRLAIYKKHVYSNPELIRCHIRCDNPNLIEFGYAYTFKEANLNKVTPLKIKMEFRNVENQYKLFYEVEFYKGINISQS